MMVSQRSIRAALALVVLLAWGAWGCSEDGVVVPADDTSSADIVDGDTTHEDSGDTPGADACEPLTCALLDADCGTPSDGCGALLDCGTCVAPLSCSVINRCTCIPDCVDKVCGDKDGCDGTCTLGSGCCVHDCDAEGEMQCDEGAVSTCGEFDLDLCRDWSESDACDSGVCLGDACCETLCDTKECGDDGCGGSCGECPGAAPICTDAGECVLDCTADCAGKECGSDGCGGVCGTCPAEKPLCDLDGICHDECQAQCDDKECGDDGCGGTCGTCPEAASLCTEAGKCVADCTPNCGGKSCGDDGCGGTCGSCSEPTPVCSDDGVCVEDASGCTDVCDFQGQTTCYNGDWYQECGDWDGDGCLEWNSPGPCSGTGNCVNGACEQDEPDPGCASPMAPVTIIQGLSATGSGVCDANNMLTNDGKAAEFWSNQDGVNDWLAVEVTTCQVVDFGSLCSVDQICVEAWAGEDGCSGDVCGAIGCESCKNNKKVSLDIFSNDTNSTMNFEYRFSMDVDATSNPGNVMCYDAGPDPLQFVLVCRSACINPSTSYNAFVDYVWLE